MEFESVLRIFNHYISSAFLLLGATEGVILLLSAYIGVASGLISSGHLESPGFVLLASIVFCLVMFCAMTAMGLYDSDLRVKPQGMLVRLTLAFGVGFSAMVFLFDQFPQIFLGAQEFKVALFCSFVGIALVRLFCANLPDRILSRRALVLGAGNKAQLIENLRRRNDRRGVDIFGYVSISGQQPVIPANKLVSIGSDLGEFIQRNEIDELIIAFDDDQSLSEAEIDEFQSLKNTNVDIVDVSTFFERQIGKLPLGSANINSLAKTGAAPAPVERCASKRFSDIAFSLILLLAAAPAMVLVALAILTESKGKGPIIYRQERVGKNGRIFQVLKFRSMRTDAEKDGVAQWAREKDDRITKVGGFIRKTRLDELPQLINVLRGDMSFVGPRPERPQFVKQLAESIPNYELRHLVKPGITGWAQIRYPYGASVADAKEKLQYDLYYLKNYSFFLDLAVVLQTPQVVLFSKGSR